MSNFNRFLNMNSSVYTTDEIPEGDYNFYITRTGKNDLANATSSNVINTLVRRDLSGIINTGDCNSTRLNVNGASTNYIRENIGAVSNGSTYTLPLATRWSGEIYLVYSNSDASARVGVRKYNFYKAPGATGNGYFTEIYHNNVGTTDCSITFNNGSGTFTFNLSGTGVSARAYLDRMTSA